MSERRVVAIVGHEAAKFTAAAEGEARAVIRRILGDADDMVSGGCHLGGVDIYAEEEAGALGKGVIVHLPARLSWEGGYKQRNLRIAEDCTEAHCIVVRSLPATYKGMRFDACYHCGLVRPTHVKSGGCWTVIRAERMGKPAYWHIVGEVSP